MDIDQVIIAHLLWKARTVRYCEHPDGSLDPLQVADAGRCTFGKWLPAEGPSALSRKDFQALQAEHAAFHQAAGALVRLANGGRVEDVETGLKPQGDFSHFMTRLVTTLKRLTPVSA